MKGETTMVMICEKSESLISAEVKSRIAEEYCQGDTLLGLSSKYNFSLPKIKTILESQNVKMRGRGRRKGEQKNQQKITDEETINKIIADRDSGMTSRPLGRKYGMSHQGILDLLRRVRGKI